MCIGKNGCVELGDDPQQWEIDCPLRPPEWFESEIDLFENAVKNFLSGNREECISIINQINSQKVQDWYINHGQMSGCHRAMALGITPPPVLDESKRDPLRVPKKYEKEVFERDGYRCRYCGIRLISNEFLKRFIKALDSPAFRKGPTNRDTHGIIHICNPVADHVFPWNMGGKTLPENLVASCATCNYGKAGYTIEQLGISDPFSRQPLINGWDGLLCYQSQI